MTVVDALSFASKVNGTAAAAAQQQQGQQPQPPQQQQATAQQQQQQPGSNGNNAAPPQQQQSGTQQQPPPQLQAPQAPQSNVAAPVSGSPSQQAGQPQQQQQQQAQQAAASPGAVGVGLHPVALKAKDEILTSLHLIKDIRRLETYQRDFFLKVKESLNHVQLLLDHQLMDMAWSSNLIDCEESLLKASVHLSSSSPAQINELYGVLLADREKLSHRFNELSVKSSLSEYVVNSRALLDIETVHGATESILRNEKPVLNKPDKSIPVDHTFFLANFCTTSVASSMLATFKPGAKNNTGPIGLVGTSPSAVSPVIAPNSGPYHGMRSAGPQLTPNVYEAKHKTVATLEPPSKGPYYGAGVSPGVGASVSSPSAIYNGSGMTAPSLGPGSVIDSGADLTKNVFGSHELVSAISQITQSRTSTGNKGPVVTGPPPVKPDPWSKGDDGNALLLGPTADDGVRANNGFGSAAATAANVEQAAAAVAAQQMVDGSTTDSVTSESDDGRGAGANVAALAAAAAAAGFPGVEFDSSKPLSFARIASLNLEKQSLQRITAAAAAAAAAGASSPPAQMAAAAAAAAALGPNIGPGMAQSMASAQLPMNLPPPSLMSMAAIQQQQQLHHHQQQQQQQHHHQQQQQQHHPLSHHQLSQPPGLVAPPMPLIRLPPTSNPRYFMDLVMEGSRLGRVIIEVQPAVAPKMADNFGMLVTHEKGFGYRDCQFFQAWKNESVICGDWEHNSGRGGRAALDGGTLFTPDETRLPCIRGAVGMRRMSKKHSSLNQVASQFRVILANMNTQFTGIFGHVVSGIEALDAVADIGGEGGRPEKVAAISNCGIYKS